MPDLIVRRNYDHIESIHEFVKNRPNKTIKKGYHKWHSSCTK